MFADRNGARGGASARPPVGGAGKYGLGQRARNDNRVGMGVGMVWSGWQKARGYGHFCTFWVLSGNCGKWEGVSTRPPWGGAERNGDGVSAAGFRRSTLTILFFIII